MSFDQLVEREKSEIESFQRLFSVKRGFFFQKSLAFYRP